MLLRNTGREILNFDIELLETVWQIAREHSAIFEENVISGQRSIRIFGKRFMESEMTSILVQGVGPEHKKVVFFKNHDFSNREFNSKFQTVCWFSKNLVVFFCSGPTPYTKMLVISLSINRFPKIRILRGGEYKNFQELITRLHVSKTCKKLQDISKKP